jgi:hypothetical protein
VNLQWKIADVGYKDALDGDIFLIERSLTGKTEDFTMLETYIPFDGSKEEYSFRDSLLVAALTPELIDKSLGIPLVRYRVSRASTQQMWGMDKNPTVAYVQPQFATLALLTPQNAKAEWSDRNEYRVKPYHRLDISVDWTIKKTSKFETGLNFSVYNVYNRQNPFLVFFETSMSTNNGEITSMEMQNHAYQMSLFPIIPSIMWTFRF